MDLHEAVIGKVFTEEVPNCTLQCEDGLIGLGLRGNQQGS